MHTRGTQTGRHHVGFLHRARGQSIPCMIGLPVRHRNACWDGRPRPCMYQSKPVARQTGPFCADFAMRGLSRSHHIADQAGFLLLPRRSLEIERIPGCWSIRLWLGEFRAPFNRNQ